MQYAVYRVFDEEMTLLYVGRSLDPFRRLMDHRHVSRWTPEARFVTLEWFSSREAAARAEAFAIATEGPAFNSDHRLKESPAQVTVETLVEMSGEQRKRHLAKVRQRRKRARDAVQSGLPCPARDPESGAAKTDALLALAKRNDVHSMTIRRWIASGRIDAPEPS